MTSDYEQALKDIRELILINGSYDEWLALQIMTVIGNCLPMTEMEVANTEWQRLTKQRTCKTMTSKQEEITKLFREWGDALTLAETYQELASKARSRYEAAKAPEYCDCGEPFDGPTHRQPPANLQADIAPATVEDVFNYLADQETDNV